MPRKKKQPSPPWFKFYPAAWLTDDAVVIMTPEQRGGYIQLLCHQAMNGGLPDNDTALAALSGLCDRWPDAREIIRSKFTESGGKLFNKRLYSELERYNEVREKRAKAGVESGKSRIKAKKYANKSSTHVEQNANDKEVDIEEDKETTKAKAYIVIFDHWNSKEHVAHHKKFSGAVADRITKAVNGRMAEGYTREEILRAIDNYDFVVGSPEHYFSYKWTLDLFLTRSGGFPVFTDDANPRENFLTKKNKGGAGGAENGSIDDLLA